jgi:hypothetical protein
MDLVRAEDPQTFTQRYLVLTAIEGTEVSPVACGMASQIVEGVPSALPKEIQGPRSGQDPPEGELGRPRPLLALKTILGGFEERCALQAPMPSPCAICLT